MQAIHCENWPTKPVWAVTSKGINDDALAIIVSGPIRINTRYKSKYNSIHKIEL